MIVHVKVRKYLRNFLVNVTDSEHNPLYGSEPIQFTSKMRVMQMVRYYLRKPPPDAKQFPYPLPENSEFTFLQIAVEEEPHLKKMDQNKTYLSEQAQAHIATEIYEMFCAYAFPYLEDHLNGQRKINPNAKPQMKFACLEFQDEMRLHEIDWTTIRRAYDREKQKQKQTAKKK